MKVQIDPDSRIPIYLQIYESIVTAIAHGGLKGGTVLPSARKLAKDLKINYHTANKAYNLLEVEGFVLTTGRRTIIAAEVSSQQRSEFAERWNTVVLELIREAAAKGFTRGQIESMFEELLEDLFSQQE